jgi:fructosamine-3-kinase
LLPLEIKHGCEKALGLSIDHISALSGGDINQARLLHSSKGYFFLKFNNSPQAHHMLMAEKKGLQLLKQAKKIRVPSIIHMDVTPAGSYLLLEYIPSGHIDPPFWRSFGYQLAQLHRTHHSFYGLDYANFIGTLAQDNTPQKSAVDFLIKDRLRPQAALAQKNQFLLANDLKMLESLFQKLIDLIPEEASSLLHGDLWNGNFMVSESQQAVLIDPAAAYGPREMDLAMTLLFGGFDAKFYQSYNEEYPLQSGWEQRMDIYQLYYLLAHLNMFGSSYLRSVQRILIKYQ